MLTEAAAVVPEGRISPHNAGLWNDEQAGAWSRIVDFVHSQGAVIGTQLAHAGRKASVFSPFDERTGPVPPEDGGWTPVGPSEIPFEDLATPDALTIAQIAAVVEAFAQAARRADDAGFDVMEIHAAHGYLLHEFLSPFSNTRTDAHGGDFAGRTRLVIEVAEAVRAAWPSSKPLFVRLSGTEWRDGGWDLDDTARLAEVLGARGVDLIDVSSGGNVIADIPVGPGYQVDLARTVHRESGVPTAAVGLITEPDQAEKIAGDADVTAVFFGRVALREPSWPQRAAHELGLSREDAPYPAAVPARRSALRTARRDVSRRPVVPSTPGTPRWRVRRSR